MNSTTEGILDAPVPGVVATPPNSPRRSTPCSKARARETVSWLLLMLTERLGRKNIRRLAGAVATVIAAEDDFML